MIFTLVLIGITTGELGPIKAHFTATNMTLRDCQSSLRAFKESGWASKLRITTEGCMPSRNMRRETRK